MSELHRIIMEGVIITALLSSIPLMLLIRLVINEIKTVRKETNSEDKDYV